MKVFAMLLAISILSVATVDSYAKPKKNDGKRSLTSKQVKNQKKKAKRPKAAKKRAKKKQEARG